MAKIPEAKAGLVFRYRYLRIWQYENGEHVGKERPCCVLLPLKAGQIIAGSPVHSEAGLSHSQHHVAADGEVLILLIQSDRPSEDQIGLELTIEDKRYVGLSADAPSDVIVSEVNVDTWPNGDMCLVPGRQNNFTYERALAQPVVSRIGRAFLKVQRAGKLGVLARQP
jgi:hypothetical protein